MGIVMNMSNYEIENFDLMEAEYGEEVLCSGWNPALALASQQHARPQTDPHITIMPSSLATIDTEVFLQKMYACH
jgi:hypothetical protein